jgi:multiple sugar transport system ATP-binding protein
MASITLKGLKKSYGATQIIKGVDITVEDGEFVVFVGLGLRQVHPSADDRWP